MEVRRAGQTDFEKIYPLLKLFQNSFLGKRDWQSLFKLQFEASENYHGLWLEHEGEAVGYMGLIFSNRKIKGELFSFANISSLIVKEEHRGAGSILLRRLIKLSQTHILTNFSANSAAAELLKAVGFVELPSSSYIFPRTVLVFWRKIKISVIIDKSIMIPHLSDEEKKILKDHELQGCIHILCTDQGDYHYLVGYKILLKGITFLRLCYLSNPSVYSQRSKSINNAICKKIGVVGVLADSFLLNEFSPATGFKLEITGNKLVKLSGSLDFDLLYSEVILLFPASYKNRKNRNRLKIFNFKKYFSSKWIR